MSSYRITVGDAATGRSKANNKRHFRTRLSDGQHLEVVEGSPITVTLTAVDAATVENLSGRGYIVAEKVERPAGTAATGTAGARK
jgi:hypothetical protein